MNSQREDKYAELKACLGMAAMMPSDPRTKQMMDDARQAIEELQAATEQGDQCQILKGVGKINGDGWKDTTVIGEVVYVWNGERPKPYKPGQYPRIGNKSGWTASTEQYDFYPATIEEAQEAIESLRTTQTPAEQGVGEAACSTCGGHGWIGGPTYYEPADPGEQCPDCNTLDRQFSTSPHKPTDGDLTIDDYKEAFESHRRMVRQLDVLINGEEGAAKQASLCDLVGQIQEEGLVIPTKPTGGGVPYKVTVNSLVEASRCLGIAQYKFDFDAVRHWEQQVSVYRTLLATQQPPEN